MVETTCPTCGRPWTQPTIQNADDLLTLMRARQPPRDVYEAERGGYYLTHRGTENRTVAPAAIEAALERGLIRPKYAPHLKYWEVA
jgi:hypothetical protein